MVTIKLFFLKIEVLRVQNHEPMTTPKCSNKITITITIIDKNYNYSNNYKIFIISDNISVYADHAIDKQISSAD